MNRSTRLLMLLDTLRGKRRPVTAAWLAELQKWIESVKKLPIWAETDAIW